ncbi:transmembrane protein [Mycobacteroides abscessus]|nr:transmembrane protein [Mycobacteroides abscessus]
MGAEPRLARPTSITPTGIAVWVCTVLFGMVLRRLSNQGVAVSFVVVASLVTALFLLGWRAVANRVSKS